MSPGLDNRMEKINRHANEGKRFYDSSRSMRDLGTALRHLGWKAVYEPEVELANVLE
jgi:hypothetical protein